MMPPLRHSGERMDPERAFPVPFCFQGLRPPPETRPARLGRGGAAALIGLHSHDRLPEERAANPAAQKALPARSNLPFGFTRGRKKGRLELAHLPAAFPPVWPRRAGAALPASFFAFSFLPCSGAWTTCDFHALTVSSDRDQPCSGPGTAPVISIKSLSGITCTISMMLDRHALDSQMPGKFLPLENAARDRCSIPKTPARGPGRIDHESRARRENCAASWRRQNLFL